MKNKAFLLAVITFSLSYFIGSLIIHSLFIKMNILITILIGYLPSAIVISIFLAIKNQKINRSKK
ncbi:hypothetical protein L5F24_11490 [Aliarcobacter butzleri]|uniref:hypothetical protein n=1 Tax=Aliarcobacter butzleri TaxID=28197 RepID=UPI001EDAE65A|nr:hypothetical protein [Aliarcobacter butzleri]MCG3668610.1 hypothetical protein [Aliarcobacter butzleri]